MKNSTVTVLCSFAALLYFHIGTIPVLMWMDKTSAKHAWFWGPATPSEIWASRLIFCEVMAVAFIPLIMFFVLAITAWRTHNSEHNPNNDTGNSDWKRPPAPPSFRPSPPAPARRPPSIRRMSPAAHA